MFTPGTDLRKEKAVLSVVDIALLPKVVGGDAFTVDNDSVEDESCCANANHPTISAFVQSLEDNSV